MMLRSLMIVSAILISPLLGTPVLAQQPMPNMPGMNMPAAKPPAGGEAPSTPGYRAAMEKMDRDMNMTYSGNPDRDFIVGMIPHHQGAVDMAKVELQYGKDPEIRRLAKAVIASQDQQIAQMRRWLAKHPQ